MMVAVMGVMALMVVGCKYDDAAGDDALNGNGGNGGNSALGSDVDTVEGVMGEDGVAATELPFDKDPNYTRCTDVEFEPVYFSFDASNLASSELAKIEAVAQHLKENADRVVIVEGNCDERGSNEYNLELGSLRAISIRDYLATLGIDGNRIQTKSYGEEKPAVQGSGEEAWARNRRGEFAIFKHK
jgi:peptidoglycan-associated lipoprotein